MPLSGKEMLMRFEKAGWILLRQKGILKRLGEK